MQDGAHPGGCRSSPGYKRVVDDGDDDEACSRDAPCGRKPGGHGSTDGHERPSCDEDDAREQTGLVREVAEVVEGVGVSHGDVSYECQQEYEHYEHRDADAGQPDDEDRASIGNGERHVDQRR